MIAFFCSTPYQVLLAIHIKKTLYPVSESHIYINDYFSDSKFLVERLRILHIFSEVRLIEGNRFLNSWSSKESNIFIKILNKFYMTIRYKKLVLEFMDFEDNVYYDELFLSFPDIIFKFAIKKLFDKNREININLFEDGTGGYTSKLFNKLIRKPTLRRRILHRMIGFTPITKNFKSIMVFRPDLFVGKVDIPIIKLPPITYNDLELKSTINRVFNYQDINKIDEKLIYLEQPLAHINPELDSTMKVVTDEALLKDYIIKLHPNSKSEKYSNKRIYGFSSLPWEVICLNNNMNDKILISYYSTAVLTSKIIFDQEPTVIFLYKLVDISKIKRLDDEFINFIDQFSGLYRDKSKIHIPESVVELNMILSSLCDRS